MINPTLDSLRTQTNTSRLEKEHLRILMCAFLNARAHDERILVQILAENCVGRNKVSEKRGTL